MRQLLLTLFLVAVLIGGGLLMNALNSAEGFNAGAVVRSQTNNPEASTAAVTPSKGAQFFIFAAVLFGLLGGTATFFAAASWFLNRQITSVQQRGNQGFSFSLNPAVKNSIGAVIVANPLVTIGLVVVLIVVVAVAVALITGGFIPR